ncbi:hypothetical protein [Rhodospirillum sp. A1_3_36]|uniref:hypothetical protein n=1 Tax=Rhodospirillum sp. A1_3_36 TaxID=3391666 RepID=UPI0039A4A29F
MNKIIEIKGDAGVLGEKVEGQIFLEETPETFFLYCHDWSIDQYVAQWKHAAKYSLCERRVSCFITKFERALEHPKRIDIFTIIPESTVFKRECYGREEEFKDFYITNSFVFITSNPSSHMKNREFFDKIESVYGNPFPIFPFFEEKLEIFYMYLSRSIQGISNWKVSSEKLESLL